MSIDSKLPIGSKIRKYRDEHGLSQKELAEKAGVSASTISKAEAGDFIPKPDKLQKIADALGIPFFELIDLDSELEIDVLLDIVKIHIHRREYDFAHKALAEIGDRSDLLAFQRHQYILYLAENLIMEGKANEALDHLTELQKELDNIPDADIHVLANLFNKMGTAWFYATNMLYAYNAYMRAYQISLQFPTEDFLCAHIAYNLGVVCRHMRRDSEAIMLFEHARKLYEKAADNRHLANTFFEMGIAYKNKNDLEKAGEYLKNSLELYESLKISNMSLLTKQQYVFYILAPKEPDRAVEELLSSAKDLEILGDHVHAAYAYARTAVVYLGLTKFEEAWSYLEHASGFFTDQEATRVPEYAYVQSVVSKYYFAIKDYDKCIQFAFRAAENFDKMRLKGEQTEALKLSGMAYRAKGDVQRALDVSDRIIKILEDASVIY